MSYWRQDSDGWIWRVYEGEGGSGKPNIKGPLEDTTDLYIIRFDTGWWIVSAADVKGDSAREDWIKQVIKGGGKRIAGPFEDPTSAKAAWRLIYG